MASSSASTSRMCSICLESISNDSRRGKAELICGHLFHLDCIGSEFNYRGEMRCPNCRVAEEGEWLLPDDESDDDDDSPSEVSRLDIHIYTHDSSNSASTSRGPGQFIVAPRPPTIHYHQNTVVVPPTVGGNNAVIFRDPSIVEALRRASLGPQGSNPMPQFTVPNVQETRYFQGSRQRSSPSTRVEDSASMHVRTNQNNMDPTNMARPGSMSAYPPFGHGDASTSVGLGASSSENLSANIDEDQRRGMHEHPSDGTTEES